MEFLDCSSKYLNLEINLYYLAADSMGEDKIGNTEERWTESTHFEQVGKKRLKLQNSLRSLLENN